MGIRTRLYDHHLAAGARMVDFGGWDMPLHYGSQIDEHHSVRNSAGVFDVSHMSVVDVTGPGSKAYLQQLLANDIGRLRQPGRGLYSCMLNHDGGVVDDLIVYRRGDENYRVVVNAATRVSDLDWMRRSVGEHDLRIDPLENLVMLAVQGPEARERAGALLHGAVGEAALALAPFHSLSASGLFVARTGYTGEDGWELIFDEAAGIRFWDALLDNGVASCGLGARDTLRLEAGLNLYGQDMDASVSPLECGLEWTVAWSPEERVFNGRVALEQQLSAGVAHRFVGLLLEERGIMRAGQRVRTSSGEGEITSGGFSPTLQTTIALARVPVDADTTCTVEIRNKQLRARIVRPPFVRHGKILIDAESGDDRGTE